MNEDFDRLVRRLERVGSRLTGRGRSEVSSAFAESPSGVRSLVERLARSSSLDNPLGALVAAVRAGEHRQESEAQARPVSDVVVWPDNEGLDAEAANLRDAEALVDAGLAEWVEEAEA